MLLSCAAAMLGVGVASAGPTDYEVKAAFLYNFTKFVEWPPASTPAADDPIVVGVLGTDSFATVLEQLVKNRMVNGHPISVRHIDTGLEARGVQVLFVGAEQDRRFAQLLPSIQGAAVLTVGESHAFSALGGIITFVMEDSKIRFEINAEAAQHVGLRISAQLLKLARAPSRSS